MGQPGADNFDLTRASSEPIIILPTDDEEMNYFGGFGNIFIDPYSNLVRNHDDDDDDDDDGGDGDGDGDGDGARDIIGSRYNDILLGDGGDNRLEGRGGNDTLYGGAPGWR